MDRLEQHARQVLLSIADLLDLRALRHDLNLLGFIVQQVVMSDDLSLIETEQKLQTPGNPMYDKAPSQEHRDDALKIVRKEMAVRGLEAANESFPGHLNYGKYGVN